MQHKGSNKPHKKAYPTFPFLILQEQWDMFAFIALEFEQDNRPGRSDWVRPSLPGVTADVGLGVGRWRVDGDMSV